MIPSPQSLGFPDKFASWRDEQSHAVREMSTAEYRFTGISASTGIGKSGMYMAYARITGERVLILTATKALQDQLNADFDAMGIVDLRGKNNYRCHRAEEEGVGYVSVDNGPCTAGSHCDLKANGCVYFDRVRAAIKARIVVMNYAKWIAMPDDELGELGKFDTLICDEAHDAERKVTEALEIVLRKKAVVEAFLPAGHWPGAKASIVDWRGWARDHRKTAERAVKDAEGQVALESHEGTSSGQGARRRALERLKLTREAHYAIRDLCQIHPEQWAIDRNESSTEITFDPVWPARYTEQYLFRRISRIFLFSATLTKKDLDVLGAPRDQRSLHVYRSPFVVHRRRIIQVNAIRLNAKAEQDEEKLAKWMATIDRLLDSRQDGRNIIIHAVSYRRASYIIHHSRHRARMMTHTSAPGAVADAVERFKLSHGAILVSPSVSTGYDFPFAAAETCIIAKLPFPDTRSPLMQARISQDREYPAYLTAKELVQMAGRVMRAMNDRGETLIVDDSIIWFLMSHRHLFPRSWLEAYSRNPNPAPPPRLDLVRT